MAVPLPGALGRAGPYVSEVLKGIVLAAPIIASKELNARVKEVYKVFEKTLKGWGDLALTTVIAVIIRVLAPRIPAIAGFTEEFTEAIIVHLLLELDNKYSWKNLAFFSIDEEGKKIIVEGKDGEGILCIDSGKTGASKDVGCMHISLSGGKYEVSVNIEAGNSVVFFMDNEGKWYIRLVPYKLTFA